MEQISGKSQVSGTIQAPSSKSYAQRAVAAALLADGETTLLNMELCSDTRAALAVAEALGAQAMREGRSVYVIRGGLKPRVKTIDIGESGLSARMFTPIASLAGVPVTITGQGSIRKRPMDMVIKPLKNLGVKVSSKRGKLPVTVRGPLKGGETAVDGSVSSQFLTGLLMALPLAKTDTTIYVPQLNSKPYIDMTIDVLKEFGIEIKHSEYKEFYVAGNQQYNPHTYNIEGDWSGASCLLVAGAVAGEVTVKNLNPLSMQADVAIIDALAKAGAEIITTPDTVTVRRRDLNAFRFDATQCPDLFPALVALAANCDGESVLTGAGRLAYKESNRAETLEEEFAKLGIDVNTEGDRMTVMGGRIHGADVDSHEDHRIAMATAVAGLTSDTDVVIHGAEAVHKSYPDFWDDLDSIRVR